MKDNAPSIGINSIEKEVKNMVENDFWQTRKCAKG